MLTFQQRRDTILSQFAQAKADLETLNSDIDAEIEKNKSVISTLTSKNTELASLKSNTDKWRNRKTLSFCGKNARIASRVR